MSAIAIIPARGGSKRLPRKNILPLGGRPMLTYPISTAQESNVFDSVIVTSEDKEINEVAAEAGAEVIPRPKALATDEAHELGAVQHVLETLSAQGREPTFFCVIYPTAVFLIPEDFNASIVLFNEEPQTDVVMGVTKYGIHPYKALRTKSDGYLAPMFPEECRMRSQLYPHLVASNGTFYWFRTAAFHENPTYYTERLKGYELPALRAVDIDTPEDYEQAKLLHCIINNKKKKPCA